MAKEKVKISASVEEVTPTTSNYANIKVRAEAEKTVEVEDSHDLYRKYGDLYEVVEAVVAKRRDDYLISLGVKDSE